MLPQTFAELKTTFKELRRARRLHSLTEKRLGKLLNLIYPDSYPKHEPAEMPAGRADLGFYFRDGKYAIFELFATTSQVPQDLRHLEQSAADARLAILIDPSLDDGAIFDAYFSKRPREPFPWIILSEILVLENEEIGKASLKKLIDAEFAASQKKATSNPDLRLQLYLMERDRTIKDEIVLNTNKALPQIHTFGMALTNYADESVAEGISIRAEFSCRGDAIEKGPVFKTPTQKGWMTQIQQIINEQPAILVFNDPQLQSFSNLPVEWDSFRMTLQENPGGYIRVDYKISSASPFSENSDTLSITLGR